jgi:transposase, IS6 family
LKQTNDSWRVDETYIKVNGSWMKALGSAHVQTPRVITVDKNPAYPVAVQQLKEKKVIKDCTQIRQVKYLNNIVEQDHRFIKKRVRFMLGFKSFRTAHCILRGVEVLHMLKKGQVQSWMKSALFEMQFIHRLFGITA